MSVEREAGTLTLQNRDGTRNTRRRRGEAMNLRLTLMVVPVVALEGCAMARGRWAENLEGQLQCGMSVQEVQQLTDRDVLELDSPPAGRGTHYVGSETAFARLWLWFDAANGLQWTRVERVSGLKTVESEPQRELCGDTVD
jgi:hypothetical protein